LINDGAWAVSIGAEANYDEDVTQGQVDKVRAGNKKFEKYAFDDSTHEPFPEETSSIYFVNS